MIRRLLPFNVMSIPFGLGRSHGASLRACHRLFMSGRN
jgi:hypothetical protein